MRCEGGVPESKAANVEDVKASGSFVGDYNMASTVDPATGMFI
jgi:hypothetical protein